MKWLVEGDLEMLSHTNGPQQVQPASSVSVNSFVLFNVSIKHIFNTKSFYSCTPCIKH